VTPPTSSPQDAKGWLLLTSHQNVVLVNLAGKRPAMRNQRNVQESRGRAGAYSGNLPLAWIEQEQPAPAQDGDGSVLCLAPFSMKNENVKRIFLPNRLFILV